MSSDPSSDRSSESNSPASKSATQEARQQGVVASVVLITLSYLLGLAAFIIALVDGIASTETVMLGCILTIVTWREVRTW